MKTGQDALPGMSNDEVCVFRVSVIADAGCTITWLTQRCLMRRERCSDIAQSITAHKTVRT